MKLILENVRSFVGRHEIPIKPLTLVVGENSSGKSTLLACLDAVCQYPEFPFSVRWNASPYRLGTFDTIITQRKSSPSELLRFTIGIEDLRLNESEISASFSKVRDRIVPDSVHIASRGSDLRLDVLENSQGPPRMARATLRHANTTGEFRFDLVPMLGVDPLWYAIQSLKDAIPTDSPEESFASSAANNLNEFWSIRKLIGLNVLSIGPRRVDPVRGFPVEQIENNDQGGDYPAILAQHSEKTFELGDITRAGLFETLAEFGKDSGLFDRVLVKRSGSGGSRSIQVRVTVNGKHRDLTDVGYGVSQVLPILVKVFASMSPVAALIQQPEVHLHPQAQAALGSFFARLTASGGPSLVLETHSDYLLDRIRIEIAQGTVSPDRVQILYLEKPKQETKVYPIDLDECGNILNAPPSYRQFFMREQMSLLTRTERR